MKRSVINRATFAALASCCLLPAANAQAPSPGSATFDVTWSGGAAAVPALGTWGTVALAVLVAVACARILRQRPAVLRAVLPLAGAGLVAAGSFWARDITAGIDVIPPDVAAGSCSGTATYTGTWPTQPPPCFVNSCGQPVTVSYTLVNGTSGDGDPLTAQNCTLDYFCDAADEGQVAADGGKVPSDGQPYAMAYCLEQIPQQPPP